jgi:hypothetical protein
VPAFGLGEWFVPGSQSMAKRQENGKLLVDLEWLQAPHAA